MGGGGGGSQLTSLCVFKFALWKVIMMCTISHDLASQSIIANGGYLKIVLARRSKNIVPPRSPSQKNDSSLTLTTEMAELRQQVDLILTLSSSSISCCLNIKGHAVISSKTNTFLLLV